MTVLRPVLRPLVAFTNLTHPNPRLRQGLWSPQVAPIVRLSKVKSSFYSQNHSAQQHRQSHPQPRVAQPLSVRALHPTTILTVCHHTCHDVRTQGLLIELIISITGECYPLTINTHHTVQDISPTVAKQHHIATLHLITLASSQHHLIATVAQHGLHAIATDGDRHLATLAEQALHLGKEYIVTYLHRQKPFRTTTVPPRHWAGTPNDMPSRYATRPTT